MSSHDFYAKMQSIHKEILEVEKEKKIYDKVLPIVTQLSSGLPDIQGNITSAESLCKGGGYAEGAEPYGQGRFSQCATEIGGAISNLQTAISKIQAKIQELQSQLTSLNNEYANAKDGYASALAAERAAAARAAELSNN